MTYKGRLTYAKGPYVEFVVAPTSDVDFGEILVVEGKNNDKFYIRAYDFKVKSRFSNINGVNYLMSKLDENGQVVNQEELDFYLGGNHTVKVAIAEQLCYADANNNLYNSRTCPDFFCEVRSLDTKDKEILQELKGDLELGLLKSGRKTFELPVGLFGQKSITEHIGIFGVTGSGKSNLVKVLANSIINTGKYSLLIFDVHNEYYKDFAMHPKTKESVLAYSTRPDTSDNNSNLKKFYLNSKDIEPDDIISCATFSEVQLDALYKFYAVWQEYWFENLLQYDVPDIMKDVYESTGQKFQSRTISKIKSVCYNIREELNVKNEEKDTDNAPLKEIVTSLDAGRVILVELKNVSPIGEQALASLLSKKILSHYSAKDKEAKEKAKPALIVLEEAHRFLGKKQSSSENVFARLVSEARKFNLGLCVVDQQPRLLKDQVLSQLNTLLILGMSSKADRTKIEAMCNKDIIKQQNEIKNLDCGEMIVAANYMRFATPVKVHNFQDIIAQEQLI